MKSSINEWIKIWSNTPKNLRQYNSDAHSKNSKPKTGEKPSLRHTLKSRNYSDQTPKLNTPSSSRTSSSYSPFTSSKEHPGTPGSSAATLSPEPSTMVSLSPCTRRVMAWWERESPGTRSTEFLRTCPWEFLPPSPSSVITWNIIGFKVRISWMSIFHAI